MMTLNKIEEKLYKIYGKDLFKFYNDGKILETQYTSTGIDIDRVNEAWFEEYSYLIYPVFEQHNPIGLQKEFTYQFKRQLIMMSPVMIDDPEKDIERYGLDKVLYYLPYDKMYVIRNMRVPKATVEVNKITILKIRLSNGKILPIIPDGNSALCEEDGIFIENGGLMKPTVDFFNRSACVARALREFGVSIIENPEKS